MKKVIALLLSLLIVFGSFSTIALADEVDTAYDNSLAVLEVTYDFLNNYYLNSLYSLEYEYMSLGDRDIIEAFAKELTENCETDEEKCLAIYDWIVSNVAVSSYNAGYMPIDVMTKKVAMCSGCSRLMVALLRACKIPCAVIRCYKCSTNYVTMEHLYNKGANNLHEFVMAYYNGEWVAFDRVWNARAITNETLTTNDMVDGEGLNYLADQYFILNIDGITPYAGEEVEDLSKLHGVGTIYYNNQIDYDLSCTYSGGFQVGGGLVYRFDFKNSGLCKIDNKGRLKFVNELYRYVQNDIACVDNKYYSFTLLGFQVSEKLAYHQLKQGCLTIQNGETLTITDFYFNNDIDQHSFHFEIGNDYYNAFYLTEDGSVSVQSDVVKANAEITLYKDNNLCSQLQIFIANTCDTQMQDFCKHTFSYQNEDEIHCCYCNTYLGEIEVIEEEIIVEEIEEEVIEETITNTNVETETDTTEPVVKEVVTATDLVVTETDVELTNTDVEEITMTDVTSTDIEEVVVSETDVVSETNLEVITNTDVIETPTDFVTETDTEEVTITDVTTETDVTSTNVITNTNEELEIGSGEYDPEEDVLTVTDVIEITTTDVPTETDSETVTTPTDVTTTTDTDEVIDYSEIIRQELAQYGIEISKEDWEKDLDDEDPEAETVTESNMTIVPEVVVVATPKVEAPVVSSGRSSGGSGSGSSKKLVATPVIKTEEVKVEAPAVEEVKVEEVVELPVVEEVKTEVVETVETPVENTAEATLVVKSSEKEIVKSEVNTNEIAESVEQMFETISIALTNMVKSLNTLFAKLFK